MNTATLLPPATRHEAGSIVYIYGVAAATIVKPDALGAIVVEASDGNLSWFEWDRLTDEPAPTLRFTIHKPCNDEGFANWYVTGNRPDASGDYTWGHFETHAEAIRFATTPAKIPTHREYR